MLKKIYAVLDKKQRIEVFLILIVIFINSIFELAGVSAVMPLFKAVTDPAVIDENVMFQWAMRILHLESGTQIQNMDKKKRDQALSILKEEGLSIRQIERLTGINRGVVLKA